MQLTKHIQFIKNRSKLVKEDASDYWLSLNVFALKSNIIFLRSLKENEIIQYHNTPYYVSHIKQRISWVCLFCDCGILKIFYNCLHILCSRSYYPFSLPRKRLKGILTCTCLIGAVLRPLFLCGVLLQPLFFFRSSNMHFNTSLPSCLLFVGGVALQSLFLSWDRLLWILIHIPSVRSPHINHMLSLRGVLAPML